MADFNQQVIDEFRARGGRVGGMFEGADLLLLTTVGARSGRRRTSPVGFARDGDRILVFGSNAGLPSHPGWYRNLLANPQVIVELGAETFTASAVPVRGAERDRLYAEQGERAPAYAAYQAQTSRVIPVVALHRSRAVAMGEELVRIHHLLRRDLAALRVGDLPAADLRVHCLAFCGALTAHHTREDGAFPGIEQRLPGLSPVLARLRREHAAIARWIAAGIDDLDQLADELEAHFGYEEEHLVPALNKL